MGSLIEINTDGLAKLGETICYGLGLTAFGCRKMADAESYATIKQVETATKIELLKLKKDEEITNYLLAKENRRLNNIKSITEKAKSNFIEGEHVSNEPVNEDWVNRFFNIVEDISDENLQDIWARVLSGEVKHPSSYSLRTLELLRNITKEEAELFVKASSFYIEKDFICVEKFALSLHETLLLGEIGLINNEELTKTWTVEPNSKLIIILDHEYLMILHNDKDKKINCSTSIKKISKAGIELLSLIEKTNRSGFYKNISNHFKSKGINRVFKHKILDYEHNCLYETMGEELN